MKAVITHNLEVLLIALNKCKEERNLSLALRIHEYLHKHGLEGHRSVGNLLLSLLVDLGSIHNAHQVFENLEYRNTHSWCFLIKGYVTCGQPCRAFSLYQQMQMECIYHPNGHLFVALLDACVQLKDAQMGCILHAQIMIANLGNGETELIVGTALINMYSNCCLLERAHDVFDNLCVRDLVSWNALLVGYTNNCQHSILYKALECFEQMIQECIFPNHVTFMLILKVCGLLCDIEIATEMHILICGNGFLQDEFNISVGNTLVEMYVNCGMLSQAYKVFQDLRSRDIVSWNSLIGGYVKYGYAQEALICFQKMRDITPNLITFIWILKACCTTEDCGKGQEIHVEVMRKGMGGDITIANSLVNMYAQCGSLLEAREMLEGISVRSATSWRGLISGYVKHGHNHKALDSLEQMQLEGLYPDAVTYVCCLKACRGIGSGMKGEKVHAEVVKYGMVEETTTPFIGSALVDMYSSCGFFSEAKVVFEKLCARDVFAWTSLISGYAEAGDSEGVIKMLNKMRNEGMEPNWVTVLSVLTMFSHVGDVDMGRVWFEAMCTSYGNTLTLEHYSCMVDILARAGQIDDTLMVIENMPFHPNLVIWHMVLGACRNWGNVVIGRHAFTCALALDEKDGGAYYCMFNIYMDAGLWEDAQKIDAMMSKKTFMRQCL